MRTDKVYSEEFIEKGIEYITENYNKDYINPNMGLITQSLEKEDKKEEKKKSKKKKEENNIAQEAHEAIRPTNILVESIPEDEDVFNARHRKLYKLIWNNTLESMMAPAIYKQLVVKITALRIII